MLRFLVFDEQGPAATWPLVNAHLLGSEDGALPGRVVFRDGSVLCRADGTSGPVALCLEVDAGRAGTMMLQTCRLRQREEPYRLYEELARHRLKLFLEKSEQWGLLDPDRTPEAFELFERARSAFVAGMLEKDSFRAEMQHRDSLAVATFATEKLVTSRVDRALRARFGKQGVARAIGVRVPLEKAPELLGTALHKEFDILAVPTPWSVIEPSQGRFVWDQCDKWMALAQKSGRHVIAGPLLDASAAGVPGWVRPSLADPAKLRDRLHSFVQEVVRRYGTVGPAGGPLWNIASMVHLNEAAKLSQEAMVAVTRQAAVATRQVQRDAKLLVEVGDPFGDVPAGTDGAIGAIHYLRLLVSEGVTVDSVSVPVIVGDPAPGRGSRDLMQVMAMLERFTTRKEMPPLIVTCSAPSASRTDPGAGSWREPWSPRLQGTWAPMVFQIAMSNPGIQAVIWDRLRDDAGSGVRDSGLFTADGTPKPAAERLLLTRRRLRSALGPSA
jgi:hypothetical protein